MMFLTLTLLSSLVAVNGQTCYGGSLGQEITKATLSLGYWYVNLTSVSSCSGKLEEYEVSYYGGTNGGQHFVTVAMWEPGNSNTSYTMVSGSRETFKGSLNNAFTQSLTTGISSTCYIRKGAIIGIYFETGKNLLPVVGNMSPEYHHLCMIPGNEDDSSLDCTTDYVHTGNLVLHAQAKIGAIECSPLKNIQYGNVSYINGGDTQYGAIARYTCSEGYELNGNEQRECTEGGTWDGSEPSCGIISCGNPGMVPNGEQFGYIYTYGSEVTFTCKLGYNISGNLTITCLADKTWSSSLPTCIEVLCEDLMLHNGQLSSSDFSYSSILTFTCDEGFILHGNDRIICQANGNWNGTVPSCIPVNCSGLESPINGEKDVVAPGSRNYKQCNDTTQYTFGTEVFFSCLGGYELNGSNATTCKADGSWSNVIPTCSIINCGAPQLPLNGNVSGSTYTFNSTVEFLCDNSYSLRGDSSSVCRINKTWSGKTPSCLKQCLNLQISSQSALFTVKEVYVEGETVSFWCLPGYQLKGNTVLSCNFSGLWSGPVPSCVATASSSRTVHSSSTLTDHEFTSFSYSLASLTPTNIIDQHNSSVAIYSAVIGVVVFMVLVITVAMVLLLFCIRKQRLKKNYDLQNPTTDTSIVNPMIHSDLYDVSVKQQVKTMNAEMIPETADFPHEIQSQMQRIDDQSDLMQQNISSRQHEISPDNSSAIYDDVELSVLTTQPNTSGSLFSGSDLLKLNTDTLDTSLPPAITETSFIGNDDELVIPTDGIENQVYMENKSSQGMVMPTGGVENQLYTEIDKNWKKNLPNKEKENHLHMDPNDQASAWYSEVDCDDSPAEKMHASISNKADMKMTETAKRRTVFFEPPAEEKDELYIELKERNVKQLNQDCLVIRETIGSGYFGNVHKAQMVTKPGGDQVIDVAVKTLNETATERDKIKFLQEASIMAQFDHTNVLKLHGVVIDRASCMIVTELMTKGDLRTVLTNIRPDPGQLTNEDMPFTLLNFCRQVCLGLSYLSQKGFVHRDIAARNILVNDENICKVADFGLSRDLEAEDCYTATKGAKIPIKWTAPEALNYRQYSSASDVWSYGCLLYEIWSLAAKPFQKMTNMESMRKVDEGYRLPSPPGCPKEFYSLMIQCWHPNKEKRPNFQQIMLVLLMQDKRILSIPEEDLSTHPLAGNIGASLEAGENMYKELQTVYVTTNDC